MKITPEQFIEHWTNGTAQGFVSRFEKAIFDFTTLAGEYTKKKFQSSFDSKKFIGVGSSWPPRRSKWGTNHDHPLMIHKGKLQGGIEEYQPPMKHTFRDEPPSPGHRRVYRKGSYYMIYTKAKSVAKKKERGSNPNSDNSYAAIHNTDPKFGLYYVNQHAARHSKKRPEHRQFIGFHPVIDNYVRELIPDIFEGFPPR